MSLTGRTRTQLRNDTVSRLKAAVTAAGNNVFGGRTVPLGVDTLPAITVHIEDEVGQRATPGLWPSEYLRDMSVKLILYATGTDDEAADDAVDLLIDNAMLALIGDRAWGTANEISNIEGYTISKGFTIEGDRRVYGATVGIAVSAQYGTFEV